MLQTPTAGFRKTLLKSIRGRTPGAATVLAVLTVACHGDNTRPLAPTQLAFATPLSTTPAGATINPVLVDVEDARGATIITASNAVTVALGSNPAGATLSGTTTVTAVNGVATFSDLSIDKPNANYTLTASSGELVSATSATFTISGPRKLTFTAAPSVAPAGGVMTPAIRVALQDSLGNTVPAATGAVTVTLASNPAGATLSGTTTVNAVNGVATFSDLSIDKPSSGFVLTATSGQLTPAYSASFTIDPGPPSLHVTTTTTGPSLQNNYALSIDCDSYGCGYEAQIGTNGSITVPVAAGQHVVELDAASNCAVAGGNYRTVTVSGPTEVPFTVACAATGSLSVTTSTTGTDIAPSDYTVCVDRSGNGCFWSAQAHANDAITIPGIISGPHTATLTNVATNCAIGDGATRALTIPVDASVSAAFAVTCSLIERIAFAANGTISVVHADGTGGFAITPGAAPAWSPDGSRLAGQCGQHICTINLVGTGLTQITSGQTVDQHPTWSPDGLKIAFSSTNSGTTDLYVVPVLGGAVVRLTQGVGFVGSPAWSPDGTQIAFDCQVDAGNSDICIVRADGSGFARLTTDPASDYGAAWKPDGSTLAFATRRFGSDEIVLMSAAGGSVTRIGAGLPGYAPTWSPDGTQLAFVQLFNDPYFGPFETILTARVDGSNVRTVVQGGQPAWRPHP